MKLTRREFLSALVPASALNVFAGSGSPPSNLSTLFEKTETKVSIKDLGKNFNDLKIGFISDIHLGVWLPNEVLEGAVATLNDAQVDIVVLGGDFVGIPDSFPAEEFPYILNQEFHQVSEADLPEKIYTRLGDLLKQLKPKLGTYAVYGNHDQWVSPSLCARELTRAGVEMLINRSVTFKRNLETFRIIGTDDYWTGIPRFAAAPKRESENRVLISHNPDYVSFLLENTACEFDLALSGHTHGGQIKLPIIGALGYNVTDARFGEGLVHHKRGEVFTTRGLGVVEIPVRINCPPEVSILTLTHA